MSTSALRGGVNALRFAAPLVAPVFALLTVGAVLRTAQPLQLSGVGLVCTIVAGVVFGRSRRLRAGAAGEREAELLLLVLVGTALAGFLATLAVRSDIAMTDIVALGFLAAGALCLRRQQVLAMVTAGFLVWALEVTWLGFSHVVITHHAIQLALAALLSVTTFQVRASINADLTRTADALEEQMAELARTREEHSRDLERYRSMFEDGPLGIALLDETSTFVEVNAALVATFGRPRQHILGRHCAEFVHPDDLGGERYGSFLDLIEAGGGTALLDRRIVRGDGEIRWVIINATAVLGPEGEPMVLCHVQDDTARRRMQEDLIRSRDGMRAVADIASAVQRGVDPRPVATAHVERLAGSQLALVIEPSADGSLVITNTTHAPLQDVVIDPAEQSATAHVWRTGEATFIEDCTSSPLVNSALLEISGCTSLLWQPVGLPGALDALLVIGWTESVTGVNDLARDAVRTVAVELSAALVAERLRTQLEERTRLDALTGLLNRRGWDHEVTALLESSRRSGKPFVLAVADLDHFKRFNDEFGHLEGDILLSGFAASARKAVRDHDLVARWGGEEFALALRDCDLSDALPVLERIRSTVPGGRTCSIGFATFHPDETVDECMRRVDEALYRAKDGGRDRIENSHHLPAVPSIR